MKELYSHCQCDNCTGEDCGQDNPEEYENEQKEREAAIRKDGQEKVLDELDKWIEKNKWTDIGENEKPDRISQKEWEGRTFGKFRFGGAVQIKIKELRQEGNREKHSKDIGNVSKEDMIFTPVRHVDGE